MPNVAPRIETERLILREFRREDFDAYCAMMVEPEVGRFVGGVIEDRNKAWEKFVRGPGFWPLLGYGLWIVEDRASGAVMGVVGFGQFERPIDPPLPDLPEGAWMLAKAAHGKGIGSEALAAALAWADANIDAPGQVCIIDPANAPSIALAEKYGFREVRRAPYHGEETVVFEREVPGA